jgi:quinoprotein glucose dehydrogenase
MVIETLHGSDRPARGLPVIMAAVLCAILGLFLFAGGVWLASLGGSIYYIIAGVMLVATTTLLFRGHREALTVYAVLLTGTLVWAVAEAGLDFWLLAPRGDILVPLGIVLILPWVTRAFPARPRRAPLVLALLASAVVLCTALWKDPSDISGQLSPQIAAASQADIGSIPADEWHAYGRTNFGDHFSPLTEITPANASALKVAWTFHTGDMRGPNDSIETTFEVTPLKIGHLVYLCSPHQRVFALDAATGKLVWKFDPHVVDDPSYQHLTCRGLSYHAEQTAASANGATPAGLECPRRLFLPTNDGRLIALDAATGKLCDGFGVHGQIDMKDGMTVKHPGFWEGTSPPVVTAKVLIMGGSVIDNYSTNEPSGVVRGFDVHTGKLLWAWDSGSFDENALPSATHHYTPNSPNMWSVAAADEKLGLVYLPMGMATPDIWGGNRSKAIERYTSALVALDIATGKRAWSYQTVHHDLWDMDLPSQPSLVDLRTAKGVVPAIYAPAKTGNIFVLDRRTGKLIVPAPETPVPQGAAPGDWTSPTQPYSQLTFQPQQKLTDANMWGTTMLDQLVCRIQFKKLRYSGPFTPPSTEGTLIFPGNVGMFEWGGVAFDPIHQVAIANPMAMPFISKLLPRGPENPAAPNAKHPPGSENGVQPMYGAPFGVDIHAFLSPLGLPCAAPPWGTIAGIDLTTHKVVWRHRVGTSRDSSPIPIGFKLGMPMLGGPMVTAGGVAFLTSTADNYIRAFDVKTGAKVWQDRLPAGGQSTPMSYGEQGHQYVVTAAGGHGTFGTKLGDAVIAYRLK